MVSCDRDPKACVGAKRCAAHRLATAAALGHSGRVYGARGYVVLAYNVFLPLSIYLSIYPSIHLSIVIHFVFAAEVSTIPLSLPISPCGIVSTPNGPLIIACSKTYSVYAVHPSTGHCERIAGTGVAGRSFDGSALSAGFRVPFAVTLVKKECCVYITDAGCSSICRLTLPAQWFSGDSTKHKH